MSEVAEDLSWRGTPDANGLPVEGGLMWRTMMAVIYSRVEGPSSNPTEDTIEIMRFVRHAIDTALGDAHDACAPGVVAGVKMAEHYLDHHFPPDIDKALGR